MNKGFTLMEVLIATFIASIVAVMAITSLGFALRAQTVQEDKASNLSQVQIAYVLLQNDIEQAVHRAVINRDERLEASFEGGNPFQNAYQHALYASFTRGGIINPLWKNTQSSLQRVSYGMDPQHNLVRLSWRALDQAPQSEPQSRVILSGINNMHWEFIDNEGLVFPTWRSAVQTEEAGSSEEIIMDGLPRAVRVTFTHESLGQIDWLFVLQGLANHV